MPPTLIDSRAHLDELIARTELFTDVERVEWHADIAPRLSDEKVGEVIGILEAAALALDHHAAEKLAAAKAKYEAIRALIVEIKRASLIERERVATVADEEELTHIASAIQY